MHLISADLPEVGCSLIRAELLRAVCDPSATVVDLSGEQMLAVVQPTLKDLQCFEAFPLALELWQQLRPRLSDWLRLLQQADSEPLLIPPLPGVEMLLQCLYLAKQLDRLNPKSGPSAGSITVLLPPPGQAMALLELACTGPALVEGLLEPLMLWWDQTRQSLSSLELVLRLNLPSSKALRLDPIWRQRLEHLATVLGDCEQHQLSLAMAAGDREGRMLRHRLSRVALRGGMPNRLLLHGPEAAQIQPQLEEWLGNSMGYAVVDQAMDIEELGRLLSCQGSTSRKMLVDQNEGLISLPMPGLSRDELDVQQIGSRLVLLSRGQRKLIDLPPAFQGQVCSGARLEHGQLLLRFV